MPVSMMQKWFFGLVTLAIYGMIFVGDAAACDRSPVLRQAMSGVAAPAAKASAAHSAMALAMAQAGASHTANNHGGPQTIVGLWQVTFSVEGQVVDQSFDAWNLGGTEILTDDTNPIEDNVCIGTWVQTGRRTYKLKHPSYYFDDSGNLLGTAILRDAVTLSRDGQSYSGTELVDIYDTAGNFLGEISSDLAATRISVDF